MPYTVEDGGRLNSFAQEPRMYKDAEADASQKPQLVITGVLTTLLVGALIALANYASNVS